MRFSIKIKIMAMLLAILVFPAWALADYDELKGEFDSYAPPSYFTRLLSQSEPEINPVLSQNPKELMPSPSLPSSQKLYLLAKENRQEIKKIKAAIAKMEKMVELSETMILPPFTLSLSVYENDIANTAGSGAIKPSFPDKTTASMGAGLPKNIWFGTGDSWLRQTRQKIGALKADLEKAYDLTGSMVENGWFEADRAMREADLYNSKVVELSKSALDVSSRGYESGTVSFADVINSYTTWLDVRLSLAKKLSAAAIARARLVQNVGTLF